MKSFRTPQGSQTDWLDQRIDLRKYSEKFVTLAFETSSKGKPLSGAFVIGVANPVIFSRRKPPQKRIQFALIITADALRADHLGCYGYGRPTSPNIDRFARDAVVFENAISQGPGTLQSTSSLFASVYPSMHVTDVTTSRLPAQFLTLPEIEAGNGYLTAGFVQNELLNKNTVWRKGSDGIDTGSYPYQQRSA